MTNSTSNQVFIGIGSNLSKPEQQVRNAVTLIEQLPHVKITQVSALYFSRPMGPQEQPNYINAVVSIDTQLEPLALLDALQAIENKAGRVRKENRWGARILDLDILLFNTQTINNERLTVPHYGMKEREFVLIPLAEIAPKLILPSGENVSDLCESIEKNGLKILDKSLIQCI